MKVFRVFPEFKVFKHVLGKFCVQMYCQNLLSRHFQDFLILMSTFIDENIIKIFKKFVK